MSVLASALVVEMALGGSYRQLVSEKEPTAWWRFANKTGTTARDSSGNGHHGTIAGGVSLGEEPTVPEGGYAYEFDGVDGRITFSSIAALTTTLTVEFWVRPNSPSTAGLVLGNTDGTQRISVTSTRFINVRYSAADHQSSIALDDLTWSHVMVSITGGSGTIYINGVARGTFSSFPTGWTPTRIGRYDTAGPLKGHLDELVLYGGQALSAANALEHYEAGIWTDVRPDVMSGPGLTMKFGIEGNNPQDRLASPGTADFYLRNDDGNSGGLVGYYSPGHSNARDGFTFGVMTRIGFTYSSTTYIRFTGRVKHIDPEPGTKRLRRTRVVLSDLIADIVEADLRNITLKTNTQEDDLILDLIEALPPTAQPLGYELDSGVDTIPYAFDDLGPGESAIRPASDLAVSSMGFLYIDHLGVLRYENRQARQTSDSTHTFDDDMSGLIVPSSLDGVFNRVRLTLHPKRIDTAATTVLYSIPVASADNPATISIDPGATIEVWGDYFNPSNVSQKIGGAEQVTPVSTTDYTGNASADGTGTDKTADLSVSADFFATTVKFTITNSDAAVVYVTKLQCRGKGLYADMEATVEAMSDQPYGERAINIDLPYQGDANTAQDLADYVLAQYETPDNQAVSVTFDPQRSDAFMLFALTVALGDRITITETMTGLTLADVFVQSIEIRVQQPLVLTMTLGLSATVFASEFWILEDADSDLGVNTFLGFG